MKNLKLLIVGLVILIFGSMVVYLIIISRRLYTETISMGKGCTYFLFRDRNVILKDGRNLDILSQRINSDFKEKGIKVVYLDGKIGFNEALENAKKLCNQGEFLLIRVDSSEILSNPRGILIRIPSDFLEELNVVKMHEFLSQIDKSKVRIIESKYIEEGVKYDVPVVKLDISKNNTLEDVIFILNEIKQLK